MFSTKQTLKKNHVLKVLCDMSLFYSCEKLLKKKREKSIIFVDVISSGTSNSMETSNHNIQTNLNPVLYVKCLPSLYVGEPQPSYHLDESDQRYKEKLHYCEADSKSRSKMSLSLHAVHCQTA